MEKRVLAVGLVLLVGLALIFNSIYNLFFFGTEIFLSPANFNLYLSNNSFLFMVCFVTIFIFLIAWAFSLEN